MKRAHNPAARLVHPRASAHWQAAGRCAHSHGSGCWQPPRQCCEQGATHRLWAVPSRSDAQAVARRGRPTQGTCRNPSQAIAGLEQRSLQTATATRLPPGAGAAGRSRVRGDRRPARGTWVIRRHGVHAKAASRHRGATPKRRAGTGRRDCLSAPQQRRRVAKERLACTGGHAALIGWLLGHSVRCHGAIVSKSSTSYQLMAKGRCALQTQKNPPEGDAALPTPCCTNSTQRTTIPLYSSSFVLVPARESWCSWSTIDCETQHPGGLANAFRFRCQSLARLLSPKSRVRIGKPFCSCQGITRLRKLRKHWSQLWRDVLSGRPKLKSWNPIAASPVEHDKVPTDNPARDDSDTLSMRALQGARQFLCPNDTTRRPKGVTQVVESVVGERHRDGVEYVKAGPVECSAAELRVTTCADGDRHPVVSHPPVERCRPDP